MWWSSKIGSEIRTVDPELTVAVKDGAALAIRFRLEKGAAGGWKDGDFITYENIDWGDATNDAAFLLVSDFDAVFPYPGLEVGIPGTEGYSMTFETYVDVINYLPSSGADPLALTADLFDPSGDNCSGSSSCYESEFASSVIALDLNVSFADAGYLSGAMPFSLGDLTLCNVPELPDVNGKTVRAILADENILLGGGAGPPTPYDNYIGGLDAYEIAGALDNPFWHGIPSAFAQAHLFWGPCVP
jgi:hypothetical protein